MRKLSLALIVGIGLGVVGTLAAQRLFHASPDTEAERSAMLIQSAPLVVEQALPGSKVLDVSVESPSTHRVNYEHEALYDVHVTYQYADEVKRIVFPIGFAQGTPIVPATSDIVIANDKATIVHRLKSSARR
jgi:hypothetical protein